MLSLLLLGAWPSNVSSEEESADPQDHPLLQPYKNKGQRLSDTRKERAKRKKKKKSRDEKKGIDTTPSAERLREREELDRALERGRQTERGDGDNNKLSIEAPTLQTQQTPVAAPEQSLVAPDPSPPPVAPQEKRTLIPAIATTDIDGNEVSADAMNLPQSDPVLRNPMEGRGPSLTGRRCVQRKASYAQSSARKLYRALTAKNFRMKPLRLGRSLRIGDGDEKIRFRVSYEHQDSVAGIWSSREDEKTYVVAMTNAGPIIASHRWRSDGTCAPADSRLEYPDQEISQVDVEPFEYWALRISWLLPNELVRRSRPSKTSARKIVLQTIEESR